MSEYVDDVDPANGTEPYRELEAPVPIAGDAPAEVVTFTAPEKIGEVVRAVLANPSTDPKMRGILSMLTSGLGRRLVVAPMLELLPPADAPEEWDAWLGLLVGCALELSSDGAELDVDASRIMARELLGALFRGSA